MKVDYRALNVFKSVMTHAYVITGEKRSATSLLRQVLSRHPRDKVLGNPEALERMLRDIGSSAESVGVVHFPDRSDDLGGHYSALPRQMRECVSLRHNFGLDFDGIGRVMKMTETQAKTSYEAAMLALGDFVARPEFRTPHVHS